MDIIRIIITGIVCLLLILAVIRLFSRPLRFVFRFLLNTALGFAALFLFRFVAPLLGISLGFNLFNALVIAVLGLPGMVLLILVQMVFL